MLCSLYNILQNPLALLFPPWMVLDEANEREPRSLEPRAVRRRLLGNDPAAIPGLARELVSKAREMGVCDDQTAIQVQVALEEALTNAVVHGNLEVGSTLKEDSDTAFQQEVDARRAKAPFAERVVCVDAVYTPDAVRFRIEDEGPGFDPQLLPDPTLPENIERGHGRGVAMMRSFMDCVQFKGRGNVVTMWKRRPGAGEDARMEDSRCESAA